MKNNKTVQIMQVIRTELTIRGEGVKDSPSRIVEQFWDMEGNLLFEIDPHKNTQK